MNIARRLAYFFLFAWFLLAAQPGHARHAAILIDASNGMVLYELEANQSWYPASLTKLMTVYMTFEALESGRLRLDRHLNVSHHASRQPTSKLGLRPWDTISVEDAIIAIVTRSANDAAVVLGEAIGGSEKQFAVRMTSTAHRLGMLGSHFMNATGLPHDWQTTTAHDMGLLAMRLIRDFPQYYSYFGVDSMYFNGREYRSINKFVNYYPGAEGMKTGYTCGSGYNLVATANQYGKRLIGVVLGGMTSSERYEHMFMMMDMGFSNPYPGYRTKNINTMSKHPIGTPPYQLSCGHRPTSHYASHNVDDEDDADDRNIRYVKKYKESHLLSNNREKPVSKPKIEPVKIVKMPEPIHLASAERIAHPAKTRLTREEKRNNPPVHRNHEPPAKPKGKQAEKPAAKTKPEKAEKAQKPLKLASKEKSKGYYVPPNLKSGKKSAVPVKTKTPAKPLTATKSAAKPSGKGKKGKK